MLFNDNNSVHAHVTIVQKSLVHAQAIGVQRYVIHALKYLDVTIILPLMFIVNGSQKLIKILNVFDRGKIYSSGDG